MGQYCVPYKGGLQLAISVAVLGAAGLIVPQHYYLSPELKQNYILGFEVGAGSPTAVCEGCLT